MTKDYGYPSFDLICKASEYSAVAEPPNLLE